MEYSNATINLKILDHICTLLLTGVNKNKIERLFFEIIAFRIQLKGIRFYAKIALLISNQNSVKKYFICCKEEK